MATNRLIKNAIVNDSNISNLEKLSDNFKEKVIEDIIVNVIKIIINNLKLIFRNENLKTEAPLKKRLVSK